MLFILLFKRNKDKKGCLLYQKKVKIVLTMANSKDIFIGCGSNLGDKTANIMLAYQFLDELGYEIISKSSFYQTPPWGFAATEDFVNSIICIHSELPAEDILKDLKSIEAALGRTQTYAIGYSSRIIDLDIIDYKGEVNVTEHLALPHPHLTKRNFVLCPLKEIAPHWQHPVSKDPVDILLNNLDLSDIKLINNA